MILISAPLVPEGIGYEFLDKAAGHGFLGNLVAFFVSPAYLFTIIVWLLIGIVSFVVAKHAKLVPGTLQTAVEEIIGFVTNLADEMIGHGSKGYYPLLLGLFIFILVSNVIGLIPGLISPTSNPTLPFGFAIMVFVIYNFVGVKENGLKYFKKFLGPTLPIYMLPIRLLLIVVEFISFFAAPFTLGLRLFCNIFAKELFLSVMAVLLISFLNAPGGLGSKVFVLMPFFLRPVVILLGLLLGIIQAFVFVVLTISYISGALHAEEH